MRPSAPVDSRPAPFALFTDRAGVAALEMAIVFPVFFALVIGCMNFGVAFYKGLTVQWSVESAARRAMIDASITEDQLQSVIDQTLAGIDSRLTIDISLSEDTAGSVPVARVSGAFSNRVEIPFMPVMDAGFEIDIQVPRPAPVA